MGKALKVSRRSAKQRAIRQSGNPAIRQSGNPAIFSPGF
jgi:hypothetical protein